MELYLKHRDEWESSDEPFLFRKSNDEKFDKFEENSRQKIQGRIQAKAKAAELKAAANEEYVRVIQPSAFSENGQIPKLSGNIYFIIPDTQGEKESVIEIAYFPIWN